jgi:hypothetical protein
MSWFLALYHPPSAVEPCFTDRYKSLEAVRVAVGQLKVARGGDEILFRFETPETATDYELDELRSFGLVNGEPMEAV